MIQVTQHHPSNMAQKNKTDRPGILSSMKYLQDLGYDEVENIHHPADLRAKKNGEVFWFEVKYTESRDDAFGAATLTEWECALDNPDNFFFLIANKPGGVEDKETEWNHFMVEPTDFMQFSTIPPAKIYFTFPLQGQTRKPKRRTTTIQASSENLRLLIAFFEQMRDS